MNAIEDGKRYDEDVARREWLTEQVKTLMRCEDADDVMFFSGRKGRILWLEGFADKLAEELAGIDRGAECWVVQCLLAVGRGDHNQAELIYDKYLRDGINAFAEKLIKESME